MSVILFFWLTQSNQKSIFLQQPLKLMWAFYCNIFLWLNFASLYNFVLYVYFLVLVLWSDPEVLRVCICLCIQELILELLCGPYWMQGVKPSLSTCKTNALLILISLWPVLLLHICFKHNILSFYKSFIIYIKVVNMSQCINC